jgi:hypothetical protein
MVGTIIVVINNHIAIIQIHIGKNRTEDVLLDGSFGIKTVEIEVGDSKAKTCTI